MAGNDLTNTFIANTYQNLVQMPDTSKQEFYNGIGATISVINRDGIGTVKMLDGDISITFDVTGLGLTNTDWLGWAICNGQNGTPDLSGRFIVGYGTSSSDYDAIGKVGGEEEHTLVPAEIPPHTHRIGNNKGNAAGSGNTLAYASNDNENANDVRTSNGSTNDGSWTDGSQSVESDPLLGQAHENRPPYYVLCYVKRIN